ncbi:MAG: hypothetical protein ACMUIP_02880 [bacterium]
MKDELEQLRLSAKLTTMKFKTFNTALLKELYDVMLRLEDMKTYYQAKIKSYPCDIKMIGYNLNRLRSCQEDDQTGTGSLEEQTNKISQKFVTMTIELLSAKKKLREIAHEIEMIGAAVDDIKQINRKIDSISCNTENVYCHSLISH